MKRPHRRTINTKGIISSASVYKLNLPAEYTF